MKLSRLQRVIHLLTVLQADRSYRPDELAKLLHVSRRTLFRDLDTLYRAGIPCYFDDEQKGYRVDHRVFLPPLNLELPEALALLLAANYAADALPLLDAARHAALKIQSSLPAHVQTHCGAALRQTSARWGPHARHAHLHETLNLFQQALRLHRRVRLTYLSFHEQKQIATTLEPLHLHFAQRAWYIIARSLAHKEIRTFKLGRMKNVTLLEETFTPDPTFSIENYFGDAWTMIPEGQIYHVVLHFQPHVAANVAEVVWHRRQQLAWHDDGALTFRVDVDGLGEIAWWILGYGDQVEVLEPPQLRQRLADTAQRMNAIYTTKKTRRKKVPTCAL